MTGRVTTRATMRAMLARPVALLVTLPLAVGGLAGCGEGPPVTGEQPRPVLSEPNRLDSADNLTENDEVQLVNVTFIDGVLTGDVGSVPVVLGSPLRITVVTDVADTVTVEGFGQEILTAIDQPVQLELIAMEAGEFDVKLQDSGKVLTTLVVG